MWGLALASAWCGGCHVEGYKNVAFLAGREVQPMPRQWYWAQPMNVRGIPNFCKVTDDLYRGDEPSANGMKAVREMGVRTVICVRSWSSHGTKDRMKGLGMRYEQIFIVAWQPTDDEIVQFLRIMADRKNRPVFMHCYTGGDRVGLLTAFYRVVYCGWPKEEALNEMLYGGYAFHEMLVKYLATYFENANIDELKRRAGVTDQSITPADRAVSWERLRSQPAAQPPDARGLEPPQTGSYNGGYETDLVSPGGPGGAGDGSHPRDDVVLPPRALRDQRRP